MALYVVGDVHGHLAEMVTALREIGLVDEQGDWTGADTRLWFLGDLTDRGPDGIGVIDFVRALQPRAAAAGGEVGCLLGNHDMMLYGSRYVPDSPVSEQVSIFAVWTVNGGQDSDLEKLDGERSTWLAGLPAVALVDDHLLVHADTIAYLELGDTVDEINSAFADMMAAPQELTFGLATRRLFRRFDFRDGAHGVANAQRLLATLGGRRVVHGHSTIPETFGIDPSAVDGPMVYADGLAISVDTGIALGARCVPVRLPLPD